MAQAEGDYGGTEQFVIRRRFGCEFSGTEEHTTSTLISDFVVAVCGAVVLLTCFAHRSIYPLQTETNRMKAVAARQKAERFNRSTPTPQTFIYLSFVTVGYSGVTGMGGAKAVSRSGVESVGAVVLEEGAGAALTENTVTVSDGSARGGFCRASRGSAA